MKKKRIIKDFIIGGCNAKFSFRLDFLLILEKNL